MVISKANKMLGLLKRTCPLLTKDKIRRSLYLSLVKSQLSYATEIWSPSNVSLKIKIEGGIYDKQPDRFSDRRLVKPLTRRDSRFNRSAVAVLCPRDSRPTIKSSFIRH